MKKKFIIIAAILAVTAVLTVCLTACTKTITMEQYKERGYFVLGFDAGQVPMGFIGTDGEYTGIDIEVAKEVGKMLGLEVRLQPIIWEDKEMELKSGKIDCVWNGFTVTDKLRKKMAFSKSYMYNNMTVIVMSNSPYTDLESLKANANLKVAYQSGSTAEAAFKSSELPQNNSIAIENNSDAVTRELATGKVDCVVIDSVMAEYAYGDKAEYRVLSDIVLAKEEYAVGFRKTETEFAKAVGDAMEQMHKSGALKNIFKKYFPEEAYEKMIVFAKANA